ncbi:MAG: NAD-dependent epimerase/dehydratase family protein [Chitinophagia bacterium]|nr:NAD-dependent epimerase/dehydratase family protein [Chitinophagia bacterium]
MEDYKKILITGTAGFIGFHLVTKLLNEGFIVVGVDSINKYYDVQLKYDRLKQHGIDIIGLPSGKAMISSVNRSYYFYHAELENKKMIELIFEQEKPDFVINLARHNEVKHLIYASSSSVYGLNKKLPFSTDDSVDHPISLYAATKKSNELMAHTYSHLFNIPTSGLRFFTVYGPWGRPDMALFKFTKAILAGEEIQLYNNGDMIRDFTYVADIVESIFRLINKPPVVSIDKSLLSTPSTSTAPFRVFNIGNNNPVHLLEFLKELEAEIGKEAIISNLPMQAGDVQATHADVKALIELIGFSPSTSTKEGISNFVAWYRSYYNI